MSVLISKIKPAKKYFLLQDKYNHTKTLCIFILLSVALIACTLPVAAGILSFFQGHLQNMLSDIIGGTLNDGALDVFKNPPWENDSFKGAWAIIEDIHKDVIRPVGYAIVGLCFMIKIAKISTEIDKITYERFLAPFIQLLACLFLVSNSYEIVEGLVTLGVALAQSVHDSALSLLGADVNSLMEGIKMVDDDSAGIFTHLSEIWQSALLCFQMIIPHLAYRIVSLLIKVMSYGVIIELIVRATIFPLFGADIMLHGTEGHGVRFVKGFLAVCLQGTLILVIAAIMNALSFDAVNSALGNVADIDVVADLSTQGGGNMMKAIGQILLFDFSGVVLMMKSSQITREVLGV